MNILITGTSSEIGYGLAKHFSEAGHQVYGISRRETKIDNENFHHLPLDLLDYPAVQTKLPEFLSNKDLDLAILNAGVLGKIQPMAKAELDELKNTMELNLWSQKVLLDTLLSNNKVETVIGISSGAAWAS